MQPLLNWKQQQQQKNIKWNQFGISFNCCLLFTKHDFGLKLELDIWVGGGDGDGVVVGSCQ